MLTKSEIRSQIQNMIERSDSVMQTRIDGYIDQRYRNIWRRRPWIGVVRQVTIAQISGQNFIILPSWIKQVIDVHQTQTPVVLALRRYYNWLKQNIDGASDSGHPLQALPVSKIGILATLPSNGVIAIISDNANDTTQAIRVRGYSADLVPIEESISANGTSTATGSVTFIATEGYEPWFSKDAVTEGSITISRDGTTIAVLGPKERMASYMKWKLWPEPSTNNNLFLTVKKAVQKLDNDEDTPEIENIEDAIIQCSYAQTLEEKRQIKKDAEAWSKYETEISLAANMEPVFTENFQDQLLPEIQKNPIDQPYL